MGECGEGGTLTLVLTLLARCVCQGGVVVGECSEGEGEVRVSSARILLFFLVPRILITFAYAKYLGRYPQKSYTNYTTCTSAIRTRT